MRPVIVRPLVFYHQNVQFLQLDVSMNARECDIMLSEHWHAAAGGMDAVKLSRLFLLLKFCKEKS